MELTVITLDTDRPHTIGAADSARLVDLLWASAAPGERLEHISVRTGRPGRLHLGLFTVATPERTARSVALTIWRRAFAASPLHGGWRTSTAPPVPPALPTSSVSRKEDHS
ncbi:hypothetical protein [Streptomyces sp. G45]|uniref:hypothetical protein n=1 Tax=Streptomyces sp. G45 TaxID=3406627 RepID=UPI003C15BEAF